MTEYDVRKLTRALVECAMTIHEERDFFEGKSFNEVGEWISKQLTDCGFPNGPVGSTHVYLDSCLFDR